MINFNQRFFVKGLAHLTQDNEALSVIAEREKVDINKEVNMEKARVWQTCFLMAVLLAIGGCTVPVKLVDYSDSNPLPVRMHPNPTGGVFQCRLVGGPCQTSPTNYDGKVGCNGPGTICHNVSGVCQCVPL